MSDIIRLLPDSVANQIAAGEVIKRPASVIKEVVENAADAGATEIKIIIKDAGKTLIQVIDNGSGMSETDARMAFERHATSKIRNAEDLFTLQTMGFRGEALPSICAISEVEIKTRKEDSKLGTQLIIAGSKVESQTPCVCEKGTVISVRKLFFNTPARRKFLKSDNVELSNILKEFERLALVNNHIRFSLDTGSRTIDLRAGTFRQRIIDLWKSNLENQLLPIDVTTSLVKIEGYITRPEFARRRNPLQFLIANGRNMRHQYFHKAIVSCYDKLIAPDTQPCYFLKFSVEPSTIDVNRSPTKDEIKFEYEQQIWPILVAAVKAALGKYSAVPSIDFTIDALNVNPPKEGEAIKSPKINISEGYNPFKSSYNETKTYQKSPISNWEKLYENFSEKSISVAPTSDRNGGEQVDIFQEELKNVAPVCLQYGGKYIVTTTREGIVVIDQHRAHVKLLYEEYLKRAGDADVVSQSVMFPETVCLDESQLAVLEEIEEDLRKLGFSLEYESDNKWLITSIPAMLKKCDSKDLILRILDSTAEESVNYGKDNKAEISIAEKIALSMAKSSAIKRGDKLSVAEMENIVVRLFTLKDPSLSPTGNSVFYVLDEKRIEALFR